MSNFVIILGKSGSGKSTSIKTLDPKATFILNVLGKNLPFKGSASAYSKDNNNMARTSKAANIIKWIQHIDAERPEITTLVLDDIIYSMREEFFDRRKERGYDKYSDIGGNFRDIIAAARNARNDLNIYAMMHNEDIISDGSVIGTKVSTIGKLVDEKYNPLENVTATLQCQPKYDENGRPVYGFYTHTLQVNGVPLAAKTPAGMFEEDFIPNDLALVNEKMKEYYN